MLGGKKRRGNIVEQEQGEVGAVDREKMGEDEKDGEGERAERHFRVDTGRGCKEFDGDMNKKFCSC